MKTKWPNEIFDLLKEAGYKVGGGMWFYKLPYSKTNLGENSSCFSIDDIHDIANERFLFNNVVMEITGIALENLARKTPFKKWYMLEFYSTTKRKNKIIFIPEEFFVALKNKLDKVLED